MFLFRNGEDNRSRDEAVEKLVCYSQFPRGGVIQARGGAYRRAAGSVRRQKEQGKAKVRALIVVSAGRNRCGRVNEFRIY